MTVMFIVVGKAQSDDRSVGADLIVFNAKIATAKPCTTRCICIGCKKRKDLFCRH